MTAAAFAVSMAFVSLAVAVDASAKILALEDRCRCAVAESHARYVRCVKRNAKRYIRLEARFARDLERRRMSRAEVRAAARARVADAVASRCGVPEHRCDVDRPCPTGETCDVRGCDATAGVCVPTPASCPTDGARRCTCATAAEPWGLVVANDCERVRAGVHIDPYQNPPFYECRPACGGPEHAECPTGLVCNEPDGTCGAYGEHGRCGEPSQPNEYEVCGCDGTAYTGRGAAAAAGVRILHNGKCGSACGGPLVVACLPGTYCMKPWGVCGYAGIWGDCRALTDATCFPTGPMCGCDGNLYPRACDAVFAGTDVAGYPVDGACF